MQRARLNRQGGYRDSPPPNLIILDLNLPKKDGREVLAELKKKETLKQIPVLVLSNSQSPFDGATCYQLQAASYLSKPKGFPELLELVRSIQNFWLSKVLLPFESDPKKQ